MKRLNLLIALLIISTGAFAQLGYRHFIGLTLGPSIPLGDFASKSATSKKAGYAMTGYSDCLINYGWTGNNNMGISASVFYNEFNVDKTGTEDWWKLTGITAGPLFTFPMTSKFFLDLKPKAGLFITSLIIDGYQYSENIGTGPGIDLKVSVRYNLFRKLCIIEENGYFYTHQKYTGWTANIQAVTFDLGLAYCFGRR